MTDVDTELYGDGPPDYSQGMSLMDEAKTGTKPKNFRIEWWLLEYLEATSKARRLNQTEVLHDVAMVDKMLGVELAEVDDQVRAYAKSRGLDISRPEQFARALAEMVKGFLSTWKKAKR